MLKIIILFLLTSQFILGCSFIGNKEVLIQLDCPKYFVISNENSILFKNNSIISISNNPSLSCYQKISEPDNVYIEITNNYLLLNAPDSDYFESNFNSLLFITNRSESLKIHSESNKISFNNLSENKSNFNKLYTNKLNFQFSTLVVLKFSDYQRGLRIFAAIN
jgi:hypothetical protein